MPPCRFVCVLAAPVPMHPHGRDRMDCAQNTLTTVMMVEMIKKKKEKKQEDDDDKDEGIMMKLMTTSV